MREKISFLTDLLEETFGIKTVYSCIHRTSCGARAPYFPGVDDVEAL